MNGGVLLHRRRFVSAGGLAALTLCATSTEAMSTAPSTAPVIDDLSRLHPEAANGSRWALFTDGVMGGVSRGVMTREPVAGRSALRMRGDVSLDNNGGFVQIALDLDAGARPFDASGFVGIELEVCGPAESYGLHLRTPDLTRPWQSYRQSFQTSPQWSRVRLPFSGFEAYRTDAPLDLRRLRRLGLVAIGRAFQADLAVASIRFHR